MRYAVYDFDQGKVLEFTIADLRKDFDIYTDVCVVMQSTTDEDRRYLGDKWQCHHCLKPEDCTLCNPAYERAMLDRCLVCNPERDAWTWHIDGKCLHCGVQS